MRIYVRDAEGAAVEGAVVKAKAIGAGNEPVYQNGGGTLVQEVVDHSAATTGLVTLTLPANATLIPSNSYYRITIKAPTERKERVLYIIVPNTAGPFDIEDVLSDPGTVETSALAAHKLSVADHGDVDLTGNAVGKVLMWDGTNFVPADTHATDLEVSSAIAVHNADTTAVHGIADTSLLETQAGAQSKADTAESDAIAAAAASLATHAADTTAIHGIADTSLLETAAGAQAKVDAHVNDTTDAHDASAISVTGGGTAQEALDELDSEKAPIALDKVHATTSVVNTTTETTIYSKTLAGNSIGTGNILRLAVFGDYLNNSGSNATLIFRIKFGATTVLATAAASWTTATTRRKWFFNVELHNVTASSQRVGMAGSFSIGGSDSIAVSANTSNFNGYGTATEDTSTSKDLVVTVEHGTAASTIDLNLHGALLEKVV